MDKFKIQNLNNWILLLLLIVIVGTITYYRVRIQMDIGPPYDTFDYLANAAEFAGQSIGYSDPRPPFLSFLTSLVFRLDGLSEAPIFIIDGIIYVFGAIGFYLFLKTRFNKLYSFFGTVLYTTFPIVLTYVGVGYPDLPSVSISIWALYLTTLAVKKDSKYFLAAFPLVMISFLTKFNQVLIIFPIIFYLFINWQHIKNRENLFIGIILSSLVLIPFLIFFSWKYGNSLWLFMDFYGTSEGIKNSQTNTDLLFYIKYIPFVIGNAGLIILLVIFGGVIFSWLKLIKEKVDLSSIKSSIRGNRNLKILILVTFLVLGLSFGNVSYIISELLFLILIFAIYKLSGINGKYDMDFLFFSWFMAFLIFQSIYILKDIRYFLCLLPALTYFLIRGLNILENQLRLIKNRKLSVYIIPVLVLLIIMSTSFYLPSLALANQDNKNIDKDMEEASKWLFNHDSAYKSKVIYSDLWALSGWYLQTEVRKMPKFVGNMIYYYSAPAHNITKGDIIKINDELVRNQADYYFSVHDELNLTNYTIIQKFNQIIVYKRK